MKQFVITSTPRSGTKYIYTLLHKLGVAVTQEYVFRPEPRLGPIYDISWLAVPYLPVDALLFHQTRHPVATINSIIDTGHMYPHTPNTRWLFKEVTEKLSLEWPKKHTERAIYFWVTWHKKIEEFNPVLRYRVEKLMPHTVQKILKAIDIEIPEAKISMWLSMIPTNVNARRTTKKDFITWNDLTEEAKELAEKYGYGPL